MRKVVVAALVLLPLMTSAQVSEEAPGYVQDIDYTLEQPFGGQDNIASLAEYINVVYAFALGIVGIIAVVLIMAGGLRWVAAAGNESAITEAKEIITSAVTGLAIALLSYVILAFINPSITSSTLSIPVIAIGKETSIVDLPKCDSADFNGKTCTNPDTSTQSNCETITCNQQGFVDGNYCRGIACGDGEGGCYRGPVDPMAYSCQNIYCGQWAQNCAETRYKNYSEAGDPFKVQYRACACNYYTKVTMPLFDLSTTSWSGTYAIEKSTYDDKPQEAVYKELCTENDTQANFASKYGSSPATYGYSGTAASAQAHGWNCGFTNCGLISVGGVTSNLSVCWAS